MIAAVLAFIPSWLRWALVGLAGACLLAGGSYLAGKHEGRQAAAVDAMAASVKALQSRNKIDDQITASDAARLCDDLGLHDNDKAECMRRVAEADAKPRDFGHDPAHGSTLRKSGSGAQQVRQQIWLLELSGPGSCLRSARP